MLSPAYPWPSFGSRPLLGTNGTEAMMALLDQGGGSLVDYLKVGPFMGQQVVAELARRWPLMLHLDDTLSSHALPSAEMIQRIGDWIVLTDSPWTSEHIGFSVADADLDSALITQPVSALLPREVALANIVRNGRALAAQLSVPLLLENIPLFPNLAHMFVCEPDFVAEVIEATGCDLLLDIAHARCSADVLGIEIHDYLSRLPLERTVEIHLSGPRLCRELDRRRHDLVIDNATSVTHIVPFSEDNLIDAHMPMQDVDYVLLEWALMRTEPRAVSLEYFREPEPLREQLERLAKILGRPSPA
jgi:uncharacterized protein (UPF0276 family)